jgi:uncharacterized membrane protein
MHHRRFLSQIDDQAILKAIREADQKTSGQVRVFVSYHKIADALEAARRQFRRLGMTKTKGRNAVLIFIAPKSQKFAIFGDVAIDQKCGVEFWQHIRDEITPHLKEGQYTAALVHAVTKAGEKLAEHFPAQATAAKNTPDPKP